MVVALVAKESNMDLFIQMDNVATMGYYLVEIVHVKQLTFVRVLTQKKIIKG